jgi:hypothetical protein
MTDAIAIAQRERRMTAAWLLRSAAVALTVTLPVACADDPLIEAFNEIPIADAKVLVNGAAMEQTRDGSIAALAFPFSGEPVTVTLDGTSSHDLDGKIAGYRWLSGTRIPDAGIPRPWGLDAGAPEPYWRSEPAGEDPGWPSDVAAPTVQLGEGTWTFSLWVVDNRGAWSSPDSIRFTIGRATGAGGSTALVGMDAGVAGAR